MQTSEWICNKLGVEVATNFEWKLQQSTKYGWKFLRKPAVGGCNKLRSEVATNCVWKVATNCEYTLLQSTNCGCKLQQTAIGICNQLRLQSAQTMNCCGWKLKLQRTAVGNGNKLRMEVATNYKLRLEMEMRRNCGWKMQMQETAVGSCKRLRWAIPTYCKWWKLQQTTKREVVTNFFQNVFFKNMSF